MFEVRRSKEADPMLPRKRGDHDPLEASFVPKHFGIAEVLHFKVEDRITGVLGPGTAFVIAISNVLRLQCAGMSGVDCDETRRVFFV